MTGMKIQKGLEVRLIAPEKIFTESSWHGMGGPTSLPLNEEARSFLFAQGDYAGLVGICSKAERAAALLQRAEGLLGEDYVGVRVTDEAIEAGHFPSFGMGPGSY